MRQIQSIEDVTAAGTELEALEALRQKVARTIDASSSGRDIAALSRQLVGIMTRIAEIKAENEEDEIDVLLKNRQFSKVRDSKGRAVHHRSEEGG